MSNSVEVKKVRSIDDLEVGMFIKLKDSLYVRQITKIEKDSITTNLKIHNYDCEWNKEEILQRFNSWSYNIDGPYTDVILNTNVKVEPEWKIRHLKPDNYKVGKDIAITILYKDIGDGYFEYKYAICNPKDMFSRKEGVKVALAKKDTGKVYLRTGASLFANILLHIAIGNRVSNDFYDLFNNLNF